MELNGRVRGGISVNSSDENVVCIVHIEDSEAVNAARSLVLVVVLLCLIDLHEPFLVWRYLSKDILNSLSDIVIIQGCEVVWV